MKKWIILFLGLNFAFFSLESHAQLSKIGKEQLKYLQLLDDSLGSTSERILDELNPAERLRADSLFTRMLVRGMVVPYSFFFPFDSLLTAPVLYPEDSTFRIITWHYSLNDADYRQKGVLQINTADGSPKFFPLFDISEYTEAPQDSVRDNRNWIGAIYYKIVTTKRDNEKIYALFGYDENNSITTRKWIEPLTFNEKGEPVFGGDYFRIPYSTTFTENSRRYLMEYKTGSRARLNFDDEDGMVIMDHLISESNEPERRYTLVPGGDYSGLKWDKGAWVYIPRLDTEMRGDGNEPRPSLILNDDGTANEDVLQKQSDKNMKQPATPANPIKTPAKTKKGN
jgi:hypothetical protein